MADKTYFEILQEQAALEAAKTTERGPELTAGPHKFTIIGGAAGEKDGRAWEAVVARHTNGHEYRLFYNLFWPLKEGELEPRLNVIVFNWICAFDKAALATYKEPNFKKYFDSLTGSAFEITYTVSKKGKTVIDFDKVPMSLKGAEEELHITSEELNFDDIE